MALALLLFDVLGEMVLTRSWGPGHFNRRATSKSGTSASVYRAARSSLPLFLVFPSICASETCAFTHLDHLLAPWMCADLAANSTKYCSEINFLCIHKKLRSKRLAPVLIKEVTRRCHQAGVFQAIYTGGAYLPTPVARCQYYHRSLDTKKLVNLGFSGVPRHKTLAGMIRENALPTQTQLPGLREMREEDVRSVHTLLRAYLSRFEMSPLFDEAEVKHQFVSGQGTGEPVNGRRKGQVIWSYVVEDPSTKEITDFFSLYHLPSTAIRQNQTIDAAYMYYYATSAAGALTKQPTTSSDVPAASWSSESSSERLQLKKRLVALIGDALIVAKNVRALSQCGLLCMCVKLTCQTTGPLRRLQRANALRQLTIHS